MISEITAIKNGISVCGSDQFWHKPFTLGFFITHFAISSEMLAHLSIRWHKWVACVLVLYSRSRSCQPNQNAENNFPTSHELKTSLGPLPPHYH